MEKANKTRSVWRMVATFFCVGNMPFASGTWGTVATLPFVIVLGMAHNYMLSVAVIVTLFVVGRYAAHVVAETDGIEDPKYVVIDEVVGMMITMLFVPVTAVTLALGFILFRFFDITKPWIIKRVERYPKGYGIMFDDMLAGVFANIILQIAIQSM